MSTHPGISLRIRWRVPPTGELLDLLWADSDQLSLIARMGNQEPGAWYELFPGDGMVIDDRRDLVIDVRPERLSESLEDAIEDIEARRRWRWRHTCCAGVIVFILASAAGVTLDGQMPHVAWCWIATIVLQAASICMLGGLREREAAR